MNDNHTSFSDSSFATFSRKWAFSCLKSKILPFSSLSLFFISISNSTKTESHKMLYLATQDKVRKFTLPVSDNFFSVDSNALWIFCFSRTWFSSTCWNHLMQSLNLLLCSVICSIFAYHNKIELIRIQNTKTNKQIELQKTNLKIKLFCFRLLIQQSLNFLFCKLNTPTIWTLGACHITCCRYILPIINDSKCLPRTSSSSTCGPRCSSCPYPPPLIKWNIICTLFLLQKNSKHRD